MTMLEMARKQLLPAVNDVRRRVGTLKTED